MMIWENSWMCSRSIHVWPKNWTSGRTQAPFDILKPRSSSPPTKEKLPARLEWPSARCAEVLVVMPKSSENAGRVRLLFVDTDLIQFNVQCIYISVYTDNYSIYIALQSIANTDYILLLHNPLSLCRRWLVCFGERYCHKTPSYIGTSLRWKLTTWLSYPPGN